VLDADAALNRRLSLDRMLIVNQFNSKRKPLTWFALTFFRLLPDSLQAQAISESSPTVHPTGDKTTTQRPERVSYAKTHVDIKTSPSYHYTADG
jgi:hypothetical protein